ncbi:MAG: glycoside hydrolase family 13 protein [Bacillota bacterium]|nr:glycoside hydrolase family 13 protein [Bacillota bacterium]
MISGYRPLTVPSWVEKAVFYQIFPERFANGDPTNDPPGVLAWGEEPGETTFFGGDLQGIIEHLDYLGDLGITALYLNPIFASVSPHKYDTCDYYQIDSHFGDERVFKRLVGLLHDRKIKIILDGVFNHVGDEFWAFQDVIKRGTASPYVEWFHIYSFPVRRSPRPTYAAWWGFPDLPKLNTDNPVVQRYLFNAVSFWMKEFQIDGWRLDVPNEVSHTFWRKFREIVKQINPEAFILGEIWTIGTPWLQGDQFDSITHYQFRDVVLNFFARKRIDAGEFHAQLLGFQKTYPPKVQRGLINLLGSHDTERIATIFLRAAGGDISSSKVVSFSGYLRMKAALLFQFTYPGVPLIYYGDEIGMLGEEGPACRRPMIWEKEKHNQELFAYYKDLIKLRNTYFALQHGNFLPLCYHRKKNFYVFARQREEENEEVIIVLNNNDWKQTISFPVHRLRAPERKLWKDFFSGEIFTVQNGKVIVENVDGNSGLALVPIKSS